jgi:hypothetical protein
MGVFGWFLVLTMFLIIVGAAGYVFRIGFILLVCGFEDKCFSDFVGGFVFTWIGLGILVAGYAFGMEVFG